MTISKVQQLLGQNQVNSKPQPTQKPVQGKPLSVIPAPGDSLLVSKFNSSNPVLPNLSFTGETNNNSGALSLLSPSLLLGQLKKTNSAGSASFLNLPARPANASTGSRFMAETEGLDRTQREQRILQEISRGNVPDFVREMKEITVSGTGKDGRFHTAKVRVMPDYLAIGSNEDFIRIPMNPLTAQKIADLTGTVLPTSKIVDDVYSQASVKLTPQPMQAGPKMMSNEYYRNHQAKIESQRFEKKGQLGQLTAGHKKDVILSNMLEQVPGRVAIYGWHQPGGKPIQGTSTVHEDTYADYSHGVRLVSAKITVDGTERNLNEVLKDPNLAFLVSKEGPIRSTRIRL